MEKYVLWAAMITSFMGAFVGSGINVAVPAIGQEFSADAGSLSRVVSSYLFGSAMLTMPMGRLADICGRKKIYTIGAALFGFSLFMAGIAISIEMLTAVRFCQGLILSMIFGPGMALLVSVFDSSERGRVIGLSTAAVYVGLTCGPAISGFICHFLGWRMYFFLSGIMSLFSLWLVLKIKGEWYGDRTASFDYKGSACFMVAAPLMLYGLSNLSNQDGRWMLIAGLIGMLLFVKLELGSEYPMLNLNLFRSNREFTCSNLASMLHYGATYAVSFLMSLYLQLVCGLDAPEAGMIILVQSLVMAVVAPRAGSISDHIRPGKVASAGMAVNALGLIFLSMLDGSISIYVIIALLMWIGFGSGLFSSPNNNAIMGSVDKKYYGTATSVLSTMRIFGQAISMAVVTFIMDVNQVRVATGLDNIELLNAVKISFGVFAVLCLTGVAMSLARNRGNAETSL